MIALDQLEALRDAVGDGDLQEHEPVALDGVAAALTLSPSDGDRLSRTLAELRRCGLAVAVRGSGSFACVGNPPTGLDAFLSTGSLVGIEEFDASEGRLPRALGHFPCATCGKPWPRAVGSFPSIRLAATPRSAAAWPQRRSGHAPLASVFRAIRYWG